MPIEKIVCPVLNAPRAGSSEGKPGIDLTRLSDSVGRAEVFVLFGDANGKHGTASPLPLYIMCQEYIPRDGKCALLNDVCTYAKGWQELEKPQY